MPDPFDIRRLLRAAQAAPSILNTQPWVLRVVADDRIQLRAEPGRDPEGRERHLKVTDGRGREMIISCGAALFNLVLAIRVTGHDPVVGVARDREKDPNLLATVNIGLDRPQAATIQDQHLYEAIQLRHTIREPFEPPKLPMNIMTHLEQAGRMGPVDAHLLPMRERTGFSHWAAEVNRRLRKNTRYVDELRAWTGPNAGGGRGVPTGAFGPLPEEGDSPIGDLGLAWDPRRRVPYYKDRNAQLIVLRTRDDKTADWMYAGQALQRLLLTATHYGVQASFMTQPFEELDRQPGKHPDKLWPWPRTWHIVIRLGYARERYETPHESNLKFQEGRTAQTPSIPGGIPRGAP